MFTFTPNVINMTRLFFIVNLIFILSSTAGASANSNTTTESTSGGNLVCEDNEVVNSCPNKCTKYNDFCPKSENYTKECTLDDDASESCGKPVCVCGFNSKRVDSVSGKCIPTRDCPPFNCSGSNEKFNACPPYCPTDSCSQATPSGKCPLLGRIGIVLQCKPACRCIENYWRDDSNTCVPYLACPGKCPYNERFSSCIQAECRALNCTQKDQSIPCPDIAEGFCKQGCVCVEGTLRAANGSCVPEDKCSADNCPYNERFSSCIQAECRALNCTQKDQSIPCPRIAEGFCKQGCVCLEGTLRADNGSCVPEDKCPVTCPANEEYSNCTQAVCRELNCTQRGQPLDCQSEGSAEVEDCQSGCICQSGYLRTPCGTCVPQNQCYGNLVCKNTEVVNTCPNYTPSDRCPTSEKEAKTQFANKLVSKPCPKKPVCECKSDYMKAPNGTCIPTRDCPPFECSGKNQEYNPCPPLCPSDDCSQATPTGKCPFGRIGIVLPCRPTCRCIPGYWKNSNGICVPYAECPGKCSTNEEFSSCVQRVCRGQTCDQKGQPIDCPEIAEESCQEGCVCVEGTLKNATGTCVPEDECPNPTCGENEFLSNCSNACDPVDCPKSYAEEQATQQNCSAPAVCLPTACRCLPGYRRDCNGKCICIGKCPGICPKNEKYTNCTKKYSSCRPQNCPNSGLIDSPATGPCEAGCVCKKGTMRDSNGNCVPKNQCPKDSEADATVE